MEHIICRHLLIHFEKHRIRKSRNRGFRPGYFCETQLLINIHDLLSSHDAGIQTDLSILDFSKAFDAVPNRKVLHQLDKYVVRGTVHTWLGNFLTKWKMRVVLAGEVSEEVSPDSGVPKGTVLGPLLFLCHMNDFSDSVESTLRLFADDCLLYREIRPTV